MEWLYSFKQILQFSYSHRLQIWPLQHFFGTNIVKKIKKLCQRKVEESRINVPMEGTVLSAPLTPVMQEV